MAWPAIQTSDFTGVLNIPQHAYDNSLQAVIDEYYPVYARIIVGQAVYSTIESAGAPLPDKYDALLNGTQYTDYTEETRYFRGLIPAIKRAIYFEYVRDSFSNSAAGFQRAETENSRMADPVTQASYAKDRLNYASEITHEGLRFVKSFTERLVAIDSISGSTVNTSDTALLADGDTVTIEETDYTISNLIDNTSFDLNGTPDPNSDTYSYTLFDLENYCPLETVLR